MGIKYIEDINDDEMDKWISDLRSGNYVQTQGVLYKASIKGMCCLGVRAAGAGLEIDPEGGFFGGDGNVYHYLPPKRVIDALNLPSKYAGVEGNDKTATVRVDARIEEHSYADDDGTISVTVLNDYMGFDFEGIAQRLEDSFLREEYK